MILDRRENASTYLGLNPMLDVALRHVAEMDLSGLEAGSKTELEGERVFYMVSQVALRQRSMNFEYHRRYIDIHMPVTGKERIALCSVGDRPEDAPFDAEKDCGFFEGKAVNTVDIPAGWFCVCFPDDAHVPGIGEEGRSIVKVVMKIMV